LEIINDLPIGFPKNNIITLYIHIIETINAYILTLLTGKSDGSKGIKTVMKKNCSTDMHSHNINYSCAYPDLADLNKITEARE